jgi:ribonucleoside-diphosphate reductase alpha chain
MYIINRKNERELIRYDKITDRNIELSKDLNVDASYLSKLVIESLKSGMTTMEIDELSAETAFYMSTYEPDYDILAARISISNLHKQTSSSFYETMKLMHEHENNGKKTNIISDEFMSFVEDKKEELDRIIDYSRDYNYSYFGFKTLTKIYLNKINGKVVERPQHMLMRVAVCVHLGKLDKILESYNEMSMGKFTHASPTLFNSGSARPQLASCFLLKCEDDLEHIYETNKRSALISKYGGGIGIDISNVRCKGSIIHANNGKSDGIVPMCKVFNATANYCNQAGRRKGSIAMYLQPWHPDILDFLALRYNNPPEELRARDLFTAMWIPDIFMRRVEADDIWSLFDPNTVRELCDTYGEEFDKIYERAENEGRYIKQIKARDVWKEVLHSQQETGLPYIAYKDSINRKNNQKNIGIIRSSNLCSEILEYTDTDSVAVCNLSSLSLPSFVRDNKYDFSELARITKIAVRNLNKVIDITYYPVKEAENNNLSYRPIGLGIQGLADVFAMFRVPWGSELATKLNRVISEVIYYYALEASYEVAQIQGPYKAFEGSPVSRGILQYDMWETIPLTLDGIEIFGETLKLDWEGLKEKCKSGVRNSLLIALMPTATSSQILNNNEAFEPFTSNIYTRSTMSGDFIMVNKHLAKHLKELNLWDKDMVNRIIEANGSVQDIEEIPRDIRDIYKTVWEISQKIVIDYAADRGAFVDQSQSMNIFIEQPSYAKLSSMHMYGWKRGLKTGSYYIRSKPSRNAVKFTIMKEKVEESPIKEGKKYMLNGKEMICTDEVCVSCSS